MNENINLCEILKGYEGETFYSPLYGEVKLLSYCNSKKFPIKIEALKEIRQAILLFNGHFADYNEGECMLFPSKDQRDWNKWVEEHKPKTPKTWSELNVDKHSNIFAIELKPVHNGNYQNYHYEESIWSGTPIEKSTLAFLKIHQLIEHSYGGNVTNKEWIDKSIKKYYITFDTDCDFYVDYAPIPELFTHIVFHTKKQAGEFLSYPENVQLLKDYFLIN